MSRNGCSLFGISVSASSVQLWITSRIAGSKEIMKRNNSDDNGGGTENSAKRLEIDDLATQTIDLADLLTKHVTSSGSFDIRGGIWATTFGKLLQALPIPAVLVDRAFEVAAANEAWKKLGPGYTEALCGRFSELFGTPSAARKIQSAIEEVFRT